MVNARETSQPFVIFQAETPREVFAKRFLASHDFDMSALRKISQRFGLGASGNKSNLLDRLEVYFYRNYRDEDGQAILEQLIERNKNWFTFRTGLCTKQPILENPRELIFSPGKSGWHGPVVIDNKTWYIGVSFIPQWEYDEISKQILEYQIRWLCFANVSDTYVSLHWQGFTFADKKESIEHESQFPYWKYIPTLFDEIQKELAARLDYPVLHNLVLHDLWEDFRLSSDYEWEDLRIRAESGGVSLNVQSPGKSARYDDEIDISDIKHLAKTLSISVAKELDVYPLETTRQVRLEESILRTLIREFGAKSYEFSLSHQRQRILRAHFYFGTKPSAPSRDCFPHVNCYAKWGSSSEQLNFILQHLKSGHANRQPEQTSFLK